VKIHHEQQGKQKEKIEKMRKRERAVSCCGTTPTHQVSGWDWCISRTRFWIICVCYCTFVSDGFVSQQSGDYVKWSVKILQDTGASESFILKGV
jgi:hypothetical protein